MNKLEFIRQNGNVPKTLPGQDRISGIIFYATEVSEIFKVNPIQMCSSIEQAEALGITTDIGTDGWDSANIHYQLTQIFRITPGITLYLGIFEDTATKTFHEVKLMQNYANGDIRQLGVWNGKKELSAPDLTALQGVADALELSDMPLSIVYAPKVSAINNLPKNLAGENKKNISVVIGDDALAAPELRAINDAHSRSITGLGIVLALIAKAAVHESISWVAKFPTGVGEPAFSDGTKCRNIDSGIIEALDNARYVFFRTYTGYAGAYVNDSHNMDSVISDYDHIEDVRVMDKAIRGIRTYLLPALGSPLTVDPETGQLDPATIKHLEVVANQQLIAMKRAGELSGYIVEIDPEQDVLATSCVEFVIKNVAKAVFRRGRILIGYAKSIN